MPETGVIDDALRWSLFPHAIGLIGDCYPGNDEDCHTVRIPRRPFDLRLDKTGPAFCEEGGECIYEVTVTNAGPETYTDVIAVTDTVPAGADYLHATGDWTCNQPGGPGHDVICTSDAAITLDPGESVSFDLSLHLPDAIEGDTVTDRACINWEDMPADHDADLPNDCAEVITPVPQPQIDLAMEKTGPAECAPGGECDYTMLIHNNGPDDFATPLTVTDVVPDGATLLGWFPPIWNCGQPGGAGGDVTCTLPAGLTVPAHGVIGLLIGLTLPDDIAGDAVTDRACIDWDAMPADGDADPGNDCADIAHTDPRAANRPADAEVGSAHVPARPFVPVQHDHHQ